MYARTVMSATRHSHCSISYPREAALDLYSILANLFARIDTIVRDESVNAIKARLLLHEIRVQGPFLVKDIFPATIALPQQEKEGSDNWHVINNVNSVSCDMDDRFKISVRRIRNLTRHIATIWPSSRR